MSSECERGLWLAKWFNSALRLFSHGNVNTSSNRLTSCLGLTTRRNCQLMLVSVETSEQHCKRDPP